MKATVVIVFGAPGIGKEKIASLIMLGKTAVIGRESCEVFRDAPYDCATVAEIQRAAKLRDLVIVTTNAEGYVRSDTFKGAWVVTAHEGLPPMGADLITRERRAHLEREGFDSAHDDEHKDGEIAMAAVCYALPHPIRDTVSFRYLSRFWPWDMKWWKPSPNHRVRELVKAGALIAAEIDRLLRAAARRGRD